MPIAHSGSTWIAWRAEGPDDPAAAGEPVLLIMGLGGSSRAWTRLIPHLRPRYAAILFDNRGTGDSDPVRAPMSMDDLAHDAVAVLDAAGIDSAHVVGVSMGGMIAQHIALDHRDRVRSLVLGCTAAVGRGGGAPPWRMLASAALRPLLGPARTFGVVAPALYAERTRREQPERVREDLAVRVADRTDPRTVYAQMAAIARHDVRARLHELADVPTLVLHGDEDRLVPPDRACDLAAAIPGARLVMLRSCGHILTTDAEAATAAAILDHLERCAARSPQAA